MQLSAFVDGELPENEAELLLRRMSQDAELRQQVAEYLAIGRAMRGDAQVPGIDRLRERVSGELGEPLADEVQDDILPRERRFMRPAVGVAIAASVALVAIFSLNQVIDDNVEPLGPGTASVTPDAASIVEQLRLRHEAEDDVLDVLPAGLEIAEEQYVEIPAVDGAEDETEDDEEQADDTADAESAVE
ncbi:MAG: sigma-E factor negative regulatory protein [Woeseiaceae bacterium]|nr:sigma-E factor negative regulatory protein [Woeseiaceae bacterium]